MGELQLPWLQCYLFIKQVYALNINQILRIWFSALFIFLRIIISTYLLPAYRLMYKVEWSPLCVSLHSGTLTGFKGAINFNRQLLYYYDDYYYYYYYYFII